MKGKGEKEKRREIRIAKRRPDGWLHVNKELKQQKGERGNAIIKKISYIHSPPASACLYIRMVDFTFGRAITLMVRGLIIN